MELRPAATHLHGQDKYIHAGHNHPDTSSLVINYASPLSDRKQLGQQEEYIKKKCRIGRWIVRHRRRHIGKVMTDL